MEEETKILLELRSLRNMIKVLSLALLEAERGQLCPDTIKQVVDLAK